MLIVLVVMWLGISGLTTIVLNFLSQEEFLPLKPRLIHSLLGMFFFALFWLITFSNAIIVWGALLRNDSALFQAQLPLKARSLYWGAAVEGGLFASWAAVVLAIPLLFTLTREAPDSLSFFPAALITVVSFLFFCLALGSWASMILARAVLWVRQHLTMSILLATVLATAAALYGLLSVGGGRPDAGFYDKRLQRSPLPKPLPATGLGAGGRVSGDAQSLGRVGLAYPVAADRRGRLRGDGRGRGESATGFVAEFAQRWQ